MQSQLGPNDCLYYCGMLRFLRLENPMHRFAEGLPKWAIETGLRNGSDDIYLT